MRRLAFILTVGAAVALVAGCTAKNFPDKNPRLPPEMQVDTGTPTNVNADDPPSETPADPPADGGDTSGGEG